MYIDKNVPRSLRSEDLVQAKCVASGGAGIHTTHRIQIATNLYLERLSHSTISQHCDFMLISFMYSRILMY